MTWLIWRQHRAAVAGTALIAALAAALLVPTGLHLHGLHDTSGGRDPEGVISHYQDILNLLIPYLVALPAAVGVFLGAPLLAREYEQRTWQLAWSQSVPRTRWLLWKIAALAPLVVLAATGVSTLFTWWYAPVAAAKGRLDMAFSAMGAVYPAHALFAFALGALAGAWLRRTLLAMGAAIAGYLAARVPVENFLRMRLLPPKRLIVTPAQLTGAAGPRNRPAPTDRILGEYTIDARGHTVTGPPRDAYGRIMADKSDIPGYFARHHLRDMYAYQPAARFWPLQWMEAGLFTALAAALLALLVLRVRRRAG